MSVEGKVGIGFRRDFATNFLNSDVLKPGFVEFAPENWIGMGGYWRKKLEAVVEKYPILCHSLSMSIGSPDDLDMNYLKDIKQFLDDVNCQMYSFHLSFAKCDNAHLYELLPIPFTAFIAGSMPAAVLAAKLDAKLPPLNPKFMLPVRPLAIRSQRTPCW